MPHLLESFCKTEEEEHRNRVQGLMLPDALVDAVKRGLTSRALVYSTLDWIGNHPTMQREECVKAYVAYWTERITNLQNGEGEKAKPDLEWLFEKKPEGIHLGRLRELYNRL